MRKKRHEIAQTTEAFGIGDTDAAFESAQFVELTLPTKLRIFGADVTARTAPGRPQRESPSKLISILVPRGIK